MFLCHFHICTCLVCHVEVTLMSHMVVLPIPMCHDKSLPTNLASVQNFLKRLVCCQMLLTIDNAPGSTNRVLRAQRQNLKLKSWGPKLTVLKYFQQKLNAKCFSCSFIIHVIYQHIRCGGLGWVRGKLGRIYPTSWKLDAPR